MGGKPIGNVKEFSDTPLQAYTGFPSSHNRPVHMQAGFKFPFCPPIQTPQSHSQYCNRLQGCVLPLQWMSQNHAVDSIIILPSVPLGQEQIPKNTIWKHPGWDLGRLFPYSFLSFTTISLVLFPALSTFRDLPSYTFSIPGGVWQNLKLTQLSSFLCTL